MEPVAFALNLGQLIGAVGGCAIVLAVLLMSLWFKRWLSEMRKARPPQREKLLHPPGYLSNCRIEQIREKLTGALAVALAAAVIFGVIAGTLHPIPLALAQGRFTVRDLLETSESDLVTRTALVAFGSLLLCIGTIGWVLRLEDEARSCGFALRAEQAVGEKLGSRELAAAGYVAFHDLRGNGGWNINHVVVGPGGVFVLETKAWPRRKPTRAQQEQDVIFDGQELQFPSGEDWRAPGQVERNARWLREFLAGFGPQELPVQPVIVVPGWNVRSEGTSPVKVMSANELTSYLAGIKPVFTDEQLAPVIRRVDERCRDVEF